MKSLLGVALFSSLAVASNSTNLSTLGLLSSGNVDLGEWQSAYEKSKALVSNMTLSQKISMITGGDVNGSWTALEYKDGTMGIETAYDVSAFSQASALAYSFDKDLMYEQGSAIGREFYLRGYQVVNGPTSGPLGRTPWSGRLGETLGQDSYLNGIAFSLLTKAFVDQGVIPGGKHFLLNEQETNRTLTPPYSSNVNDKALHETYAAPFYDAVKNGMGGVMCAMNSVNDSYSCESSDLLLQLLKTEIGFPGQVFADVDGQRTALESLNNGLDYGSSSLWSSSTIEAAIANGSFTEERLDDMAIRNAMPYYFVGLDTSNQPSLADETDYRDVRANHSKIIRKAGSASMVLLKNDGGLPLDKPKYIGLFGAHAGPVMGGPNQKLDVQGSGPTYQGHLATGSGSGLSSFPYLVTPLQAITARAIEDGSMISWILNDTYTATDYTGVGSSVGVDTAALAALQTGTSTTPSIENYANIATVSLVFLNALAGEGADRTELYNEEQDELVNTVASYCNNTIVIINTIDVRLIDHWINHENVTAVLYGSLLGEESGHSIADILYGDVNPSGRLPFTLAKNQSDYNVGICLTLDCDFTEGNYIDYKSFQSRNITPRYPFGHGLSYTTFTYASNASLQITKSRSLTSGPTTTTDTRPQPGGPPSLYTNLLNITFPLTNSGSVSGADIPQLYLSFPPEADQPAKQLRGFEKVELDVGDTKDVTFQLRRKDLSYWNLDQRKWCVAEGRYRVFVGASLDDVRLEGELEV